MAEERQAMINPVGTIAVLTSGHVQISVFGGQGDTADVIADSSDGPTMGLLRYTQAGYEPTMNPNVFTVKTDVEITDVSQLVGPPVQVAPHLAVTRVIIHPR
jgi:hypothetical protein